MHSFTISPVPDRKHLWSNYSRRWIGAILVVWLVTSTEAQVIVHVYDFDFSLNPKAQPVLDPVINIGDTVRWVWDEGSHSTTSATGQSLSWNSGDHSPEFHFDFTF